MPRKPKTHIRSPENGRESLCGRMSVRMAEKASVATCGVCQSMAARGELERKQLAANRLKMNTKHSDRGEPRYTEQQRAFAAHPLVTTNPRKAALECGYSPAYAKSHAKALREQLYPMIMEYQELAKKRAAISVAKVQEELASMGFANVLDYFELLDNGAMLPRKLNELTREQAAAIQEVDVGEFEHPITGQKEYRITSLKLADKRANLVELGKSIGMFQKFDTGEEKKDNDLRDVPTEALEEAEALLMAAVSKARSQRKDKEAVEGEFTALPPKGAVEQEEPIDP